MKRILRDDLLLILILSLVQVILIWAGEGSGLPALQVARAVLGLAFVLFIPGYCLQAAAFPGRGELDGKARLTLALGLSVAVIPLLALLLDRLPWRINLWSVTIALLVTVLVLLALAIFRRSRLAPEERFMPLMGRLSGEAWSGMERSLKIAYGVLGLALLIFGFAAVSIMTSPTLAERMTEFYILGSGGAAELYPREAVVNQPVTVTAGIQNLEGVPVEYRLEVHDGSGRIGLVGPVRLENGGKVEAPLTFTPIQAGEDVEVKFYLFRDTQAEPYRSLRLWLNVKQTP